MPPNQCEFKAPFRGKMVRCTQVARWVGRLHGSTGDLALVCDGHQHFLWEPKEIKHEGS